MRYFVLVVGPWKLHRCQSCGLFFLEPLKIFVYVRFFSDTIVLHCVTLLHIIAPTYLYLTIFTSSTAQGGGGSFKVSKIGGRPGARPRARQSPGHPPVAAAHDRWGVHPPMGRPPRHRHPARIRGVVPRSPPPRP